MSRANNTDENNTSEELKLSDDKTQTGVPDSRYKSGQRYRQQFVKRQGERQAVLPVLPFERSSEEETVQQKEAVLSSIHKADLVAKVTDTHLRGNLGTQHQLDFVSDDQVRLHKGFHPFAWFLTSPVRMICISFAAVIILGALVLALPIATRTGEFTDLFTTLFTATSAVCVTGLVVVDTASYWSLFGQVVIIVLIQIGGVGLITLIAAFFSFTKRKLSNRTLRAVQDSLGSDSVTEVYRLVKRVLLIAFSFEFIGGLILSIHYLKLFRPAKAFYYGMFQGVSAFCNAGFDLLGTYSGPYSSLTAFQSDWIVQLTTVFLLSFGGLGFVVWIDLLTWRRGHRLSYHTKIVLRLTVLIMLIGTVCFAVFEWNNMQSDSIGRLPVAERLLAAFFQTGTLRTAGFNTVSQKQLSDVSKLLACLIMFIGASPVSTGGGMKTTTVAIIAATMRSHLKGREDAVLNKHRIKSELFTRAFVIVTMGALISAIITLILSFIERDHLASGHFTSLDLLYETLSALCTVGVTSLQTENLHILSRIPLMLAMFIGRVGPFSFALFLSLRNQKPENTIFPEGQTYVG